MMNRKSVTWCTVSSILQTKIKEKVFFFFGGWGHELNINSPIQGKLIEEAQGDVIEAPPGNSVSLLTNERSAS